MNKYRCFQRVLLQMSIFDKDIIGILTHKTAQRLISGYLLYNINKYIFHFLLIIMNFSKLI